MKNLRIEFGGINMDVNKAESNEALDAQLDREMNSSGKEETENNTAGAHDIPEVKRENPSIAVSDKDLRALSVGEWMLVIFAFILPVINIVFMALWAFSSKGNVHRRNLSRASLLWMIILLASYVVAMTIAGFTFMDLIKAIFTGQA